MGGTACGGGRERRVDEATRFFEEAEDGTGGVGILATNGSGPRAPVSRPCSPSAHRRRRSAPPGAILVRRCTSPDDVHGVIAAEAVVTEQGGAISHAAVVSRALDTACVVGCGAGTVEKLVGRIVTVDATAGRVYAGEVATTAVDETGDDDLLGLGGWAEAVAAVSVVPPGAPAAGAAERRRTPWGSVVNELSTCTRSTWGWCCRPGTTLVFISCVEKGWS